MYILILLFAILLYIIGEKTKRLEPYYLLVFILIFFSGFRGPLVGRDTPYYHEVFNRVLYGGKLYVNEIGYIYFVKLISKIGGTQQLVFLIISGLTIYNFSKFILKYSKKPNLSILIFVFVGPFYLATFNQMRQYLAISIFLAYMIPLIENRQIFKYISAIILTAIFAHVSILILTPIYLILNRNISLFKKAIILLVFNLSLGFLILIILRTPYSYFILRRANLSTDTSLIFVQAIISIILILFEKSAKMKDKDLTIFFNMAFFSLLMLLPILLFKNLPYEIFLRMNNYFFPFMLILVPELLFIFTKKSRIIVSGTLVVLISLYFVRSTLILGETYSLMPYEFNFYIFKL